MTRGMKGCYVCFTDTETAEYFRSRLLTPREEVVGAHLVPSHIRAESAKVIPFRRIAGKALKPFKNAVPLIDLKFAAGTFTEFQALDPECIQWVELPDIFRPAPGVFVAQVIGESMNRRVPNGAWCIFRMNPRGSRQGKVVVAQHRSIDDPELGGAYTIKVYSSEKVPGQGEDWTHSRITLRPDSEDSGFKPMIFTGQDASDVEIVAEMISVIDTDCQA